MGNYPLEKNGTMKLDWLDEYLNLKRTKISFSKFFDLSVFEKFVSGQPNTIILAESNGNIFGKITQELEIYIVIQLFQHKRFLGNRYWYRYPYSFW